MIDLSAVSNEVFQLLRSFDYTVMMYDDDGMEVYEPEDARRFFAKPENLLVSIVDDNDDSRINLYLSGTTDAESVLGLITSLRTAANKYNMIFNDQQWDRDLTVKETVEPMDLTEGMYGTSRSSYLKLENARMIVRHSAKIDENIAGARCRRVESIFVENAQGERFMFPTKQLAPARAMTQHFNHGGSFADEIGSQITQMATDYSALGQASSYIGMNMPVMAEAAGEVRQKCRETRTGMRKCFERLYRESTYGDAAEALREAAAHPVLAEDATIARLRETLFVEGKELSEDIISTIARCVESAQPVLDEVDTGTMSDIADGDSIDNIDDEKEDGRATIKDEKGPTVSVMGQQVNQAAWEALKAGKLELRVNPESLMGAGPSFSDRQAELGYKLGVVASVVISGSLFKLFSWASEALMSRENPALDRKLMTLADSVLALAKVSLNVREGLGFRGSNVIREFEEWFDGMGSDNVLGGPAVKVGPNNTAEVVAPASPVIGDSMGDSMVEPMGDSMAPMSGGLGDDLAGDFSSDMENESMSADIALGYTEGAGWTLDFPEADQAMLVCGGEDSVNRQIAAAVLGGSRNGSVMSDPEKGARKAFAWTIGSGVTEIAPAAPEPAVPAMAPALAGVPGTMAPAPATPAPMPMDSMVSAPVMGEPAVDTPYDDPAMGAEPAVDEEYGAEFGNIPLDVPDNVTHLGVAEGDGELTREDILIPQNQNADLKQEVGHPIGPEDEQAEETGEQLTMERLRKLSGIRIN